MPTTAAAIRVFRGQERVVHRVAARLGDETDARRRARLLRRLSRAITRMSWVHDLAFGPGPTSHSPDARGSLRGQARLQRLLAEVEDTVARARKRRPDADHGLKHVAAQGSGDDETTTADWAERQQLARCLHVALQLVLGTCTADSLNIYIGRPAPEAAQVDMSSHRAALRVEVLAYALHDLGHRGQHGSPCGGCWALAAAGVPNDPGPATCATAVRERSRRDRGRLRRVHVVVHARLDYPVPEGPRPRQARRLRRSAWVHGET